MYSDSLTILHAFMPAYPEGALTEDVVTCPVEVWVDETGVPSHVRVVDCQEPFVEACRSGVIEWRFAPVLLDDDPIKFVTTFQVQFEPPVEQAITSIPHPVTGEPFVVPHDFSLIQTKRSPRPRIPSSDGASVVETCKVMMFVESDGRVSEAIVDDACDNEDAIRSAALKWRFHPYLVQEQPTPFALPTAMETLY
jgi:hypothetical protein